MPTGRQRGPSDLQGRTLITNSVRSTECFVWVQQTPAVITALLPLPNLYSVLLTEYYSLAPCFHEVCARRFANARAGSGSRRYRQRRHRRFPRPKNTSASEDSSTYNSECSVGVPIGRFPRPPCPAVHWHLQRVRWLAAGCMSRLTAATSLSPSGDSGRIRRGCSPRPLALSPSRPAARPPDMGPPCSFLESVGKVVAAPWPPEILIPAQFVDRARLQLCTGPPWITAFVLPALASFPSSFPFSSSFFLVAPSMPPIEPGYA